MEIAIAIVLAGVGVVLFWGVFKLLRALLNRAGEAAHEPPPRKLEKVAPEGPLGADGLVYLFAHNFIKPAPRRPMGAVVRDRTYSCLGDQELDPEDFAAQLLYASLAELHRLSCIEFTIVPRDPTYMPPYPQKQWELRMRQVKGFPPCPICDSLAVGFDLARKRRLSGKKGEKELTSEEEHFSLDEVLERALKAIRQEMSFWERGGICSDLRNYVEADLVARGYLIPPERETWLDRVRTKRPTPDVEAIKQLESEAAALARRLEGFRKMHGSPVAVSPETDEQGRIVDIDPGLMNSDRELDDLPLDDCLRASIHEAIVAIKQLEPSGEAGV